MGKSKYRNPNIKLTIRQYNILYKAQRGACAICKKKEKELKGYRKKKVLFIDHDHKTGAIRGLLCSRCNTAMGFQDNTVLKRRCEKYAVNTSKRMTKIYELWVTDIISTEL